MLHLKFVAHFYQTATCCISHAVHSALNSKLDEHCTLHTISSSMAPLAHYYIMHYAGMSSAASKRLYKLMRQAELHQYVRSYIARLATDMQGM
jgi:hypothetical protein